MRHGRQCPEHRSCGYPQEDGGCSWSPQSQTLSKQNVLQRYESEEEEASEADVESQDRAFSPIDCDSSDTGAFDVELSADEISYAGAQTDRETQSHGKFLFPCPPAGRGASGSRPVSIDTIKRRSDVTFVPGSFYRDDDDDDDEIISPSTPISDSPPPSPHLLHPTVFVPPEASESEVVSYHQSCHHDSVPSDDEPDVESPLLVATPIMYMVPTSRPNLISIRPPSDRSTPDKQERKFLHSRSSSKSSWSNNSARSSSGLGTRKGHSKQNSSLSSLPSTYSGELIRASTYPPPVGTPLCLDGGSYLDKQVDPQSTSDQTQADQSSCIRREQPKFPKISYKKRGKKGSTASSHSVLSSASSVAVDGDAEQTETSATITCPSEIPAVPYTASPRTMSMSFSHPITSMSDRASMYSASQKQKRPMSAAERRQSSTRRSMSNTSISSGVASASTNSRADSPFLNSDEDHHLLIKSMPHYQYMFDSQSLQSLRNARRSSMSPRPHSRRPLTSSPTPYSYPNSSSPSFPNVPYNHTGRLRPESTHSERLCPDKIFPYLRINTDENSSHAAAINIFRSSSTTDLSRLSYSSARAVSPIDDAIPELNDSQDTDTALPEPSGRDGGKGTTKRASRVAAVGKGFMGGLRLGRKLKRAGTPESGKHG